MNKTKSPAKSKINWTALATMIVNLVTALGLDLDPETKVAIIATVSTVASTAVMIFRTWFTDTKLS